MSKVTLANVATFQNDSSAVATVNANSAAISTAMDNTLSRDGTSPNQMNAPIDMNGNSVLNLPAPVNPNDPVRFQDLGNAPTSASAAAASAAAAAASAVTSGSSATAAAVSAGSASTSATTATTQAGTATTQAGIATTQAGNASTSAAAALASQNALTAGLSATSTTSLLIATGAKTFTTQAGKLFVAGQFLLASSAANNANFMHGTVTSYTTTSLVMNIVDTGGSGTFADWNIVLSGTQGPAGSGTLSGMTGNQIPIAASATSITSSVGLGNTQILIGQTAAAPTANTVSGDATLSSAGALTLANSSGTRTNLGLAIGTNVQAFDAQLSSVLTQNSKSANYTTVLTDGGKMIFHPNTDTTARVFTIDSNANVAYPIGTVLTFINDTSAPGTITIALTSDTLVFAPSGTTGSRTLAVCGVATAIKVGSTRWIISGTGLS